jgi:hypothetical protein
VALHAVSNRLPSRNEGLDVHPDKSLHPSDGRLCSSRSDAVREVAVGVLEPRTIAQCAVDVVSAVWVGQWIHVDFHRLEQLVRWVHDLAVDRMAADDYEFI